MMLVLCVGVFLAGWTRHVSAGLVTMSGDYTVRASVPGPPPTVAATIDSPAEGAKFSSLPIEVSGTCPLDTYVTLYRNGAFSGVALCSAAGTWQLQTGLFVGANQLQARVFSQTDMPGPLSNIVTVYYEPPSSGTSGTVTGTSPSAKRSTPANGDGGLTEPLVFKTKFVYNGHYTGDTVGWDVSIEGGTAPYAISVEWGDGFRDLISRREAGLFSIQHIYKKAGAYKGHYIIRLTASDADGGQAFMQLLTLVNNPPGVGAGTRQIPGIFGGATPDYLGGLFKYIWPSYLIVVLMLFSFWLGERREFHLLEPRLRKARRT